MDRIWANRLEAKDKIWNEVPAKRINNVRNILLQDVFENKISQELYKEITGEDFLSE